MVSGTLRLHKKTGFIFWGSVQKVQVDLQTMYCRLWSRCSFGSSSGCSLIWVYIVFPDLSVPIFKVITETLNSNFILILQSFYSYPENPFSSSTSITVRMEESNNSFAIPVLSIVFQYPLYILAQQQADHSQQDDEEDTC